MNWLLLYKANLNFYKNLGLAAGTAILLWLSWPPLPFTGLLFVGFVPLLYLEELNTQNPKKSFRQFLGWTYLSLLAWNSLVTYWVMYASIGGGIMALVADAFLMTIPFALYHYTRKRLKWPLALALITLVSFWFALEWLHLNWQLAWPWLNLGNAFAQQPGWVQWYEFTGTFGGSLWVWLVNIAVFLLVKPLLSPDKPLTKKAIGIPAGAIVILILLPLYVSNAILIKQMPSEHIETVVVQPNIDPYNEKFDRTAYEGQLNHFLKLTEAKTDSSTDLVIWPETSIPGNFQESRFKQNDRIQKISRFFDSFPHTGFLSGVNTYIFYDEKATPTAREHSKEDRYYDMFNSAVLLDQDKEPEFYHKSKLVPGVEQMPYPGVLGFLQSLAIEMGGTSGSLGSQDNAEVFNVNDSFKVAPVICYESIFGDYVGNYVQKGADLITIVTNDGWWGRTEGYQQHFQYAVLRAIEMRRSIARSANTGISGFITPEGRVHKKTSYWQPDVRRMALPVYEGQTVYALYGDYLGIAGLVTAGIMLLLIFGQLLFRRVLA